MRSRSYAALLSGLVLLSALAAQAGPHLPTPDPLCTSDPASCPATEPGPVTEPPTPPSPPPSQVMVEGPFTKQIGGHRQRGLAALYVTFDTQKFSIADPVMCDPQNLAYCFIAGTLLPVGKKGGKFELVFDTHSLAAFQGEIVRLVGMQIVGQTSTLVLETSDDGKATLRIKGRAARADATIISFKAKLSGDVPKS